MCIINKRRYSHPKGTRDWHPRCYDMANNRIAPSPMARYRKTLTPMVCYMLLHSPTIRGCKATLSSRYFSRSFFARFHNLVTHTLVHLFHSSLVIPVFHLAFTLSTCYSTHDSHELLWLDDYTLHFILILHSHSFIRWNEDLIDFFETSDGYTLTNRFLERSLFSIITFLRQPFLARFSKVPALVGLWCEVALHYNWSESFLETQIGRASCRERVSSPV